MKCYLCDNNSFSVVAKKNQIRYNCFNKNKQILKCKRCGLIQLLPQWTPKELDNLYINFSQKRPFEKYKMKSKNVSYLTEYIKRTDKILEIGCGTGNNLKYLKKKGYNAIGIDKDSLVCDNKLILNYDISNYPFSNKFDFIYAIQVFEHLPNPKEFIKLLFQNLNPKGRFLLEIPNVKDPLLLIKQFHKFYWIPYHLFFYEPETIKKMFKDFNIKIFLYQRYGILNHLNWLILKKPTNINIHIPIIDDIYKFFLTKILKLSDTIIVKGD